MATPIRLAPGRATPDGTRRFRDRQTEVPREHYTPADGLWLSDLGIGTYLGGADEPTDRAYAEAVERAVERGVNVIDSAINYRFQRSERSIGTALARLLAESKIRRDEIFVATKGGFVSFDGSPARDAAAFYRTNFFDRGIITPADVVAGCHCIRPAYLRHELEASRRNLGLETIDLYYLHNVETQFEEIGREEFDRRLHDAFGEMERAAGEGKIALYGLATWDGFRVPEGAPDHLSLAGVLEIAKRAGGDRHHFRAVQLPFNLAYREAALEPTQEVDGEKVPFLRAAERLGILVFSSVPLFQGRVLGRLPAPLKSRFQGERSDAQGAIAFAAAAPGMTSALAGMGKRPHVEENTGYLRQRRLDAAAWRSISDEIA